MGAGLFLLSFYPLMGTVEEHTPGNLEAVSLYLTGCLPERHGVMVSTTGSLQPETIGSVTFLLHYQYKHFYLFCLKGGTAKINFSYHLIPQPGFESMSVELH